MKHIILLLLSLSLSFFSYAQRPSFNKYNAAGEKEGIWVEGNIDNMSHGFTRYVTYKNGKQVGFSFSISDNDLLGFSMDKDGQPEGIAVSCDDGHVMAIGFDCGKNTTYSIVDEEGKRYYPDYKGYFIFYNYDGSIHSEGIVLWNKDGDWELDTSIQYGEWIYYDKNGNKRTVQYPK